MANKGFGLVYQWNERRREQNAARKAGAVGLARVKGRYQVVAPYHPGFASWARHEGGGRWRYRAEFWSFPIRNRDAVLAALVQFFGVEWEVIPDSEAYEWATIKE